MRILALLPPIEARPTGGNLFNRRVLEALEGGGVEVVRRVTGESLGVAVDDEGGDGDTADATLVDSLLLVRAAEERPRLPRPLVLVAHYLHLFEPARRDSEAASRERRALDFVDAVVTTSDYCRRVLLEEGLGDARMAEVMPGLAPAYFEGRPISPAFLDALELAAGRSPRLLTVATLLEGKGLRQLLGILEGLLDLPWSWRIAGDPGLDPDFAGAFRRRLEASPVAKRTHLLGAVAPGAMPGLYDDSHAFVLASRFESCSMATMEAMTRGLPVLAFAVGGIPERLPDVCQKCLAPPGDLDSFRDRLRLVLEDPDLRRRLGDANRDAGRAFPTWNESAERLRRFVQDLTGTEAP